MHNQFLYMLNITAVIVAESIILEIYSIYCMPIQIDNNKLSEVIKKRNWEPHLFK